MSATWADLARNVEAELAAPRPAVEAIVVHEEPTRGQRVQPVIGTLVDHSGSIAQANVPQQVMPLNEHRRYLLIQNPGIGGNGTLWLSFSTAATGGPPAVALPVGSTFIMEQSFVSMEAIYIAGAVVGQEFLAKEA